MADLATVLRKFAADPLAAPYLCPGCGELPEWPGIACHACLREDATKRDRIRAEQVERTRHDWDPGAGKCRRCGVTDLANEAARPDTPWWLGLECVPKPEARR